MKHVKPQIGGTAMRKALKRLGIFNGVMALLVLLLLFMNRTDLIIAIGIKATDALIAALWAALGGVFLLGNARLVARARKLALSASGSPLSLPNGNAQQDPANLRAELSRLSREQPQLRDLLAHGLAQMDSIDRKQAKLKEIIQLNEPGFLKQVDSTLDETEHSIWKNLVRVLNRAILWDPLEVGKPGNDQLYDEHRLSIQRLLQKNEDILRMCDTLLTESVRFVNEKKSGAVDSTANLEAMTEVIQSLREMNGKED